MKLLRQRMKWNAFLLLLGVLTACLSFTMKAQEQVIVNTQSAPVNTLTINDIDFIYSTTPKWLFTIDLRTQSGGAVTATMVIRLTVTLADGENFGGRPIVSLTTNPFEINGSRTFTNLDFRDASLRKEYETDKEAKHRFEEIALPSGTMPAGAYNFTVQVTPVAGAGSAGTFTFVLSNPTSVDLLFPSDADPAVNQFPLFQWLFDGTRSTIAVYEKLPGQATMEEAATGTPQLTADVTSNSFQYPAAGVRALEPGKTYVWFVEGHIRTAGGSDNILRSPIRSFTVQSGGVAEPSLLDDLERALDPKYRPLFDQIRADGYALSGTFRLNEATLTREDLLRLIMQLQANPDAVISAELE